MSGAFFDVGDKFTWIVRKGDVLMSELVIEKMMVIDDVECVRTALETLVGKKIYDIEIVKKYICTERNTKFFIDKKLKSSVNQDTNATYVWLDTGYRDRKNNAIFLSLLNTGREYKGHYVGTARILADSIKNFFPCYRKDISTNYSRFLSKYNQKAAEREHRYIEDENQYLLSKANEESSFGNDLALKIHQLDAVWESAPEEVEEINEVIKVAEPTEAMNEVEKEITIELLIEMVQEREQYIQELLENLEKNKVESDAEIKDLVDIIKEQSVTIKERTDALTRIRIFNENESLIQFHRDMEKEERQKGKVGHKLLENRKKILVLGTTNLSAEVMKGIIMKEYGFEEDDFEYETDYDKVVHTSGRIINSSKYQAIIFGCCPHSTAGKGKWSSIIERCKQGGDGILIVDARNIAGNLKVTKASFRNALSEICEAFTDVA